MCGSPLSQYPAWPPTVTGWIVVPSSTALLKNPSSTLPWNWENSRPTPGSRVAGRSGVAAQTSVTWPPGQVVDIGRIGWPDRRVVRPAHVEAGPGVEVGQLDALAETHRRARRAERG